MRVAIRVDSSPVIGNGHIYRCLSLALGMRARGFFVIFFTRENVAGLDALVLENGFDIVRYPSVNHWVETPDIQTWMGGNVRDDGFLTALNLKRHQIDLLIIDHYGINDEWIGQVRRVVKKIFLIDDLHRNFEVDYVLNPNLGVRRSSYVTSLNRQYLIGPKFALLRKEFALGRKKSLIRRSEASFRKLVVSIGATDPFNITKSVIEVLSSIDIDYQMDVDVILGANAPHIESIMTKIKGANKNIRLIIQPNNLIDILVESDLAIGAAGGSMLERCCLGLPSLIYVAAENQKEFARYYSELGVAFLLKDINELSQFFIDFSTKFQIETQLSKMSLKARSVTDGLGVERVVDFLFKSKVE